MRENNIGKTIAALRKEQGLTQVQLAEKLNFSYQTISNWERGKSEPDLDSVQKLCELFNITTDEFLKVNESGGEKTDGEIGQPKKTKVKKRIYVEEFGFKRCVASRALNVFLTIMFISFCLFIGTLFFQSPVIFVLRLVSAIIYDLVFIVTYVLFFVSKNWGKNLIVNVASIACLVGWRILVSANAIVMIYAGFVPMSMAISCNICYFAMAILNYFGCRDKKIEFSSSVTVMKFIYLLLLVLQLVFLFIFPLASDILQVVSFVLLCCFKSDRLVKISYVTTAYKDVSIENGIQVYNEPNNAKQVRAEELDQAPQLSDVLSLIKKIVAFFWAKRYLLYSGIVLNTVLTFICFDVFINIYDEVGHIPYIGPMTMSTFTVILPFLFFALTLLLKKCTRNLVVNILVWLLAVVGTVLVGLHLLHVYLNVKVSVWVAVIGIAMLLAMEILFIFGYREKAVIGEKPIRIILLCISCLFVFYWSACAITSWMTIGEQGSFMVFATWAIMFPQAVLCFFKRDRFGKKRNKKVNPPVALNNLN